MNSGLLSFRSSDTFEKFAQPGLSSLMCGTFEMAFSLLGLCRKYALILCGLRAWGSFLNQKESYVGPTPIYGVDMTGLLRIWEIHLVFVHDIPEFRTFPK